MEQVEDPGARFPATANLNKETHRSPQHLTLTRSAGPGLDECGHTMPGRRQTTHGLADPSSERTVALGSRRPLLNS